MRDGGGSRSRSVTASGQVDYLHACHNDAYLLLISSAGSVSQRSSIARSCRVAGATKLGGAGAGVYFSVLGVVTTIFLAWVSGVAFSFSILRHTMNFMSKCEWISGC